MKERYISLPLSKANNEDVYRKVSDKADLAKTGVLVNTAQVAW